MLYRLYMFLKAFFSALWFGFPSRKLTCYGITWTDGKSTTTEITYAVMKHAKLKVGILSTVSIDIGDGKMSNHTKLTSLSHWEFQRMLYRAVQNGLTHMVIEVSSHALYQWRVRPIKFMGVWFTNLSREHLDFHWSMEHYFATKFRLFREFAHPESVGVIPAWFAFGSIAKERASVGRLLCFGVEQDADIWVDQIEHAPTLCFQLYYGNHTARIKTQMVGAFNAENMMIASVLALHAWVWWDDLVSGLEWFVWVPWRQELVVWSSWVVAMIDFALTPDALTTLYTAVRELWYARQIAVFGATGNRDQGKRVMMGTVATRYNDYVVLTEDENYHEDGMEIIKQVESWVDTTTYNQDYTIVQDRAAAIKHALSVAKPGDIVIVTWMANFTSRAMNEWSIPRNERAVIEAAMEELGLL